MTALFAALALAIGVGAYAAHAFTRHRFLASKAEELGAIADLKVAEIVAWRAERLGDARVTAADPLLLAAAQSWLADTKRADLGAALQARLDSLCDEYGYVRVSLLGADGRPGLTAPRSALGGVDGGELTPQARVGDGVSFIDLHLPDTGKGIHLGLVAPLRLLGDPKSRPVAFLDFVIDPERFLYPLIQSWPTTSQSGETLLVRREGNFVVYLNELRHKKGTALSLRVPVSQSNLPAALAVQGKEGSFDGQDYRGVQVLAALRRVPNSPWFLVSKVDRNEVAAPLARDAWLTTLLALALIGLTGLAARRLWSHERGLPDAELRESEGRYRALFANSLSGVAVHQIVRDADGRAIDYVFLEVNQAFETLTGLKREDVVGRCVTEVLPGIEKNSFIEVYGRVTATGQSARFEQFATPLGRTYDVSAFRVAEGQFATAFSDVTERNLATERLRLQGAALEAAANAVMITDREGRIVWVNDAFYSLTGWSLEECRGRTPRIFKSGRYDIAFYHELWRRILRGDVWQHEMINRRKGGELYVEDQTITPVANERGEITHFIAIKIDTTERKRAEEALKLFRTLVDRSNDALEVVDPDTGRFLDVSERGCQDLGYNHDELLAMSVFDIDPAIDQASFARLRDVLQQSGRISWEGVHRRKDGSTFPVEVGITLVQLDRGYFVAVARDITERKRAEEAVLKEKTLSEAIVDSLPGIFYLFDQTGRFLRWNRSFETVSGYSAEEVAAMRPLDLFTGEDRTLIERRIGEVFETGAAEAQAALVSKDGRRIPHHFVAARTVVDGVPCCIGTGFDVTARKSLEAQLRHSDKLQGLGRLAGGVAHDFNNILGVITGYGELAQRQLGPDHPVRARVDQMLKAAQRAAGLTRQLLAFGRYQPMEPKVIDLNVVVADAEKMLGRLIGEDVDLVVRAAPDLGMVKADPSQIEQVVMNLAVNARDAMPEGGTLTFETGNVALDEAYAAAHPPTPPGRYVLLTVSDTGGGMDKETQAHIFEPFFTTKPVGQGTGLGLATVYGIVKQSDGYIWLYSELGRGTTFKIYLPRVDEEADAVQAAAPSPAAPGGHERILLVEDTVALREVVRETLEECGYTVVLASNGEEALALAREPEPIHLLLTDVIMPEMGGGELAKRLTAIRAGIRVLYMSGYTADAMSRQSLLGEEIVLLQKPFTGDKLARAVREALDRPAPRG